jgi:hypothetical protein
VLKLNQDQNKHIANSLRIIGMTQFAAFGWDAFNEGGSLILIASSVFYLYIEFLALVFLGENNGK